MEAETGHQKALCIETGLGIWSSSSRKLYTETGLLNIEVGYQEALYIETGLYIVTALLDIETTTNKNCINMKRNGQ